jgi:hypothetical protein
MWSQGTGALLIPTLQLAVVSKDTSEKSHNVVQWMRRKPASVEEKKATAARGERKTKPSSDTMLE